MAGGETPVSGRKPSRVLRLRPAFWRAQALSATVLALVAGACAIVEPPPQIDYTPAYAEDVVATGYEYIYDRYIETVTIRDVAMDAMRGLQDIDPALVVVEGSDKVQIYVGLTQVAELPLPEGDDNDDWGALTVAAIDAARAHSPLVAESDSERIFQAVFDAALGGLDTFSRYAGRDRAEDARAMRDGFGGIGITIRMIADQAEVISVVDGGPAARAGVETGDRITHVDGANITGWDQRRLVRAIRGPVGEKVALTVSRTRTANVFIATVKRARIVPPTVTARRKNGILHIKVASFNQETALSVRNAVRDGTKKMGDHLHGIVLDLRGNPGGLLDQAVNVADVFLEDGDIVETRGRHPHSIQHFSATGKDLADGAPMVVLVNGASASASEVVAAALQDQGRAVLVGTNSFGKGTVQTVLRLPNDGEMTLTWSRLHAPSGYRLHGLGVLPTLCTHGGGRQMPQPALLGRLRTGATSTVATLPEWRATDTDNAVILNRLRTVCQRDRATPELDLEVAEALLADPALYQSALRMAVTAVAER